MSTERGPHEDKETRKPMPSAGGMDEDLFLFFSSLIEQNAQLTGRVGEIDSLKKLAEETLAEAKKAAEVIKIEAEKKAKEDADAIVAKADAEAKTAAQNIIDKAKESGEAEAHGIISEAKLKAEAAERKAHEIMKAAEEKAESVRRKAEEDARAIRQEAEKLLKASRKAVESERDAKPKKDEGEGSKGTEPRESQAVVSLKSGARGWSLLGWAGGKKEGSAPYDETIELLVMPPVAIDQLQKLRKHLKKIPQTRVLELRGSLDSGVRIKIRMRARIPLLDTLADFPEVQKVLEKPIEVGEKAEALRRITVTMKRQTD